MTYTPQNILTLINITRDKNALEEAFQAFNL